jgi:hypothetical protein
MSDDEEEQRRFCTGEDLRYIPNLRPQTSPSRCSAQLRQRLLYCDHIEGDGEGLFRLACHDLEGVVAKHKYCPTCPKGKPRRWIRNRSYS